MHWLTWSSDQLNAVRLLLTFLITSTLGGHAYYRFKLLMWDRSPKLWAFLLYSLVFALTSILTCLSLLITVGTRTYGRFLGVRLGSFTLILLITYAVFLVGARSGRASRIEY